MTDAEVLDAVEASDTGWCRDRDDRAAMHGAAAGIAVGALWTWLWVLPALRIAANE